MNIKFQLVFILTFNHVKNNLNSPTKEVQLLHNIINFIYPKICIVSEIRLDESNSNPFINDYEIKSLAKVGTSDLRDLENKLLSDVSFSLFVFRENDNFSKIIYQLKYGGMKKLGVFLGKLLGTEVKKFIEEKNLSDFDYIIPVPLFKTKVRERGYNQSDYICQGVSDILNIEFINDFVIRNRHTKSQSKLDRYKRAENVKNAFEINSKYEKTIFDKEIILVDDVVTTGATLNEVVKVLRNGSCRKIMVCTLAMAK